MTVCDAPMRSPAVPCPARAAITPSVGWWRCLSAVWAACPGAQGVLSPVRGCSSEMRGPRMDPIVLAAGTALVTAMATDAWQSARDGAVALWRKVRPEQAEIVEAELAEVR